MTLLNQFKFSNDDMKVDIATKEDQTLITIVQLLLNHNGETTVKPVHTEVVPKDKSVEEVVKETATALKKEHTFVPSFPLKVDVEKTNINKPTVKRPPIWLIECEHCKGIYTLNRMKNNSDTFKCPSCYEETTLEEDKLVIAKYKCECGTEHNVSIHSLALIVETKCRTCEMPIDLKWNDKKERYEKL